MTLPADAQDRFSPIGLSALGGFTAFGGRGASIFGWAPSRIRNGSCFS